jgi:hypothetical protein
MGALIHTLRHSLPLIFWKTGWISKPFRRFWVIVATSVRLRGLFQPVLSLRRHFSDLAELDCFQALGIKGYTLY